jgi:DNA polymerase/3'-5' exonuclease PolX
MRGMALTNDDVARTLDRVAELLELQGANPFQVDAYRRTGQREVRRSTKPSFTACQQAGDTPSFHTTTKTRPPR